MLTQKVLAQKLQLQYFREVLQFHSLKIFVFLCTSQSAVAAVLADTKFGRYKTIRLSPYILLLSQFSI